MSRLSDNYYALLIITDILSNACVSPKKDQKIIDLMLTRHQEAEQLRSDKRMLDLAWDDQRRLENDLRQSRMRQRNADFYEQHSAKEVKQVCTKEPCPTGIQCSRLRFFV